MGYILCVACTFVIYFMQAGTASCFGVIMPELIAEFQCSTGAAALIIAILVGVVNGQGIHWFLRTLNGRRCIVSSDYLSPLSP